MIGTIVTFSIGLWALVHGVRSTRRARVTEQRFDQRAIERACTLVSFLDVVDGWSMIAHHNLPVVAALNQSLQDALAVRDEATAAERARELLEVLAPYGRMVDIVDA